MATKKKSAGKARRPAAKAPARRPNARRLTPRKQPETLRLRSISCGFTVNDLQTSLDFYTRVLGFTPGDRWEHEGRLMGMELKAGAATIWINQDDFAKGRDRVKGVGVRVYCNTAQDIDALAAGITQRGGTLDHEPQERYGAKDFDLSDPDGYKITFVSA